MTDLDVWARVADQRDLLADRLGALSTPEWAAPSACEGWRTVDVLGHLVWLAEQTPASAGVATTRAMLRERCGPMAAMVPLARGVAADAEPNELLDRLRAARAGRFRAPGAQPIAVVGEVFVHGMDITRPLGLPDGIDPDLVAPVVSYYRRIGRIFAADPELRKLTLVPTDAGWRSPGSDDDGRTVEAPAADLLLLTAGRIAPADLA